ELAHELARRSRRALARGGYKARLRPERPRATLEVRRHDEHLEALRQVVERQQPHADPQAGSLHRPLEAVEHLHPGSGELLAVGADDRAHQTRLRHGYPLERPWTTATRRKSLRARPFARDAWRCRASAIRAI